jgi:DNA-binding NarL/FixJ family response regulator
VLGRRCHRRQQRSARTATRTFQVPASCNAERLVACHANCVALRVLIVDDNGAFLDAARVLLEREGLSVVGVASTGAEALRRAKELSPDVLLVDITLGRESGIDLTRRLIQDGRCKGSPVILISTHSEADFADLIAASHAAGFVPKSELSAEAIRRIVDGR